MTSTNEHPLRSVPGRASSTQVLRLAVSGSGSSAGWLDADSLPVGVLVADPDGWVTATNQTWSDLTGLDPAESLGRGWLRCLEPGEQHVVLDQVRAMGETGGSRVDDHRINANGDARRRTQWSIRAERDDAQGRVVVAVTGIEPVGSMPQDQVSAPTQVAANTAATHSLEEVDRTIRSMSDVTFTLASMASMTDQAFSERLQGAMGDIDAIIQQLRGWTTATIREPSTGTNH